MKHFLITLLLCASSLHAQNPLKGEWITSSLLRDFKEGYQNLLVLTQREDERVGYATEFERTTKINIGRITLPLVATTVSLL